MKREILKYEYANFLQGTLLKIPLYNHKRLHQCYIMEICWDSFLFHSALPSLSLSSAFSSHLSLALLLLGVFSVAVASDIIFLFHYFLLKSLSLPYKCFSLPSLPFVFCFSFGRCTESCSFVSFLERKRAKSGLLGSEPVLSGFMQKGRDSVWDTDTWTIKSIVWSFSSPHSKDQHKENRRPEQMLKLYWVTKHNARYSWHEMICTLLWYWVCLLPLWNF